MPWQKKPERADIACMTWFGIAAVYGLIMLPMRAWLIAEVPAWSAMLNGGRASVAASGALAAVGQLPWWPVVLLVASVLSLKFDWIYWWAGKLWGRGMIEVWSGQSKRAARNYALVEKWSNKLGPWAFVIARLPVPLPLAPVVFVLSGATGMSLKRFLLYDYLVSVVWLVIFFWLGWSAGEVAVQLLDAYAKIAMYVAIAMLVVVIYSAMSKRKTESGATKNSN